MLHPELRYWLGVGQAHLRRESTSENRRLRAPHEVWANAHVLERFRIRGVLKLAITENLKVSVIKEVFDNFDLPNRLC